VSVVSKPARRLSSASGPFAAGAVWQPSHLIGTSDVFISLVCEFPFELGVAFRVSSKVGGSESVRHDCLSVPGSG
jgi:hypothetical protein